MMMSESRLSDELRTLLAEAGERPLSIGEIESRLADRGAALLMMLLSAPFLIPSVPGLSTPFGLALMAMGLQLACGRKPWLPGFVLRVRLQPETARKVLGALVKVVARMERRARPRLVFLRRGPGMAALIGLGIASGGSFLFLPIMVPVMNTLPTISILLLAAGLMESDGVLILAGYFFGAAAWVYFGAWLLLGKAGFDWLYRMF